MQSFRPLVLRVSEFQSYSVTEYIVAEWPRCRVAKLQSGRVAEIQSYRFGNWHRCKVAELESCGGTEFRAIKWLSCRGA